MKNTLKIKMVIKLVWNISPSYFFMLIFNSLIFSGQIILNVILPKYLIDELTGDMDQRMLIFWVGAIVASNLLFSFLKKSSKRLLDIKEKEVMWQIERAFAKKVMSVEYWHLEDPYYLDLKERASFAMQNQSAISNLISNSIDFLNHSFTVIGLIVIMMQLSWILVVTLLVTVFIIILIQVNNMGYQQKFLVK